MNTFKPEVLAEGAVTTVANTADGIVTGMVEGFLALAGPEYVTLPGRRADIFGSMVDLTMGATIATEAVPETHSPQSPELMTVQNLAYDPSSEFAVAA